MIGKKLEKAMNEQIKNELESYYIYLSMAAYFGDSDLDGMAHWMRCQAHEETVHAMKFFDHICDRGGKIKLMDMKQLKTEWSSPQEAWEDAFEHEQFISGTINKLVKIAREENEYASETLLAWFTDEQIEEEANTGKIANQLKMVSESKHGILMIDRELSARPFPAGSPFDPAAANAE
mgnify:CR=1 FL=1